MHSMNSTIDSLIGSYNFCSVRFLNACTCTCPVSVCIDGRSVSSPFRFAEATEYVGVVPGNHTITIQQGCPQCRTLYSQSLFFSDSEMSTFVLLDSGRGLTLSRISDRLEKCPVASDMSDKPDKEKDCGWYRIANVSYPDSCFTVSPLVCGLPFQTLTSPKMLPCGIYTLQISEACGCPSLQYSIKIQPETLSTMYLIGNPWCIKSFLAVTLNSGK